MRYPEIIEKVRSLRKNMTPSEKILWEKLRNKKLMGVKFLRQHPVFYQRNFNDHRFFVLDFYCAKYKIGIELDGKYHDMQKDRDLNRELIIRDKGIQIIRFKNEELANISDVLLKIESAIKSAQKFQQELNGF